MSNENLARTGDKSDSLEILNQLKSLQLQLQQLTPHAHSLKQGNAAVRLDDKGIEMLARLELGQRKLRSRFLPAELFGEAGWNILLDLFVQEKDGKRVSVSSACLASEAPSTTGLRYVKYLESVGLVAREADPVDQRRINLSLTDECRERIVQFLSAAHEFRSKHLSTSG